KQQRQSEPGSRPTDRSDPSVSGFVSSRLLRAPMGTVTSDRREYHSGRSSPLDSYSTSRLPAARIVGSRIIAGLLLPSKGSWTGAIHHLCVSCRVYGRAKPGGSRISRFGSFDSRFLLGLRTECFVHIGGTGSNVAGAMGQHRSRRRSDCAISLEFVCGWSDGLRPW